jgi:hypothetical protein
LRLRLAGAESKDGKREDHGKPPERMHLDRTLTFPGAEPLSLQIAKDERKMRQLNASSGIQSGLLATPRTPAQVLLN